jgi:hypothetical protein
MRGGRVPIDFGPVARDLLIGALIAAALIAAPTQTIENHLLAGMSVLPAGPGDAPANQCREHVPCDTGTPHR